MKRELIYAAVIGGVVGAVLVAAAGSFAPLGAQSGTDGHFDEITCTDLKVMSPDGTRQVSIFASEYGAGIFIYDEYIIPEVMISTAGDGGRVAVYDGERGAKMGTNEYGGFVSVYGRGNGYSRVNMGVNEYGNGAVSTWDKNRYRLATLK